MRQYAAQALGEIGDPRAVEPLIAILQKWGNSEQLRRAAALALGQIGDPRSVEPLIATLGDIKSDVCQATKEALVQIGSPSVEPLITALGDKHWSIRYYATKALETHGWQPDEGPDGAAYWIAKQEWDRCVQIGTPAVEPLIVVLAFDRANYRTAACKALETLGWKPDNGTDGVAYWIAKQNLAQCIKIGAPALAPLIATLETSGLQLRMFAAKTSVALYRSGKLSEQQRASIMKQRSTIEWSHHDQYGSDCGHTDTGIGLKFPV